MKEYHIIKQKEILKTLEVLNDFSEKFPMLKFNEINFASLGKMMNLKEKDFKVMVVFLDMLKTKKAFVKLEDVHEIKVKKSSEKWKFVIVSKEKKETPGLDHIFKF